MRFRGFLTAGALAAALGLTGFPAFCEPASNAVAPDAPATPAPPKPKPKYDPDEVICRYQEVTGSRLGGDKVCHTRREWDEISANSRDAVSRSQMGASFCGGMQRC